MSNLAIIPARGGSKRIPRKNIKKLFGKPIIAYVIEAVRDSCLFDEIMVSTDDIEIANIAKDYNAEVPFLRSKKNANDFATLTDVILEVLATYKKKGKEFDNVCCVLSTAALISSELITVAYQKILNAEYISVVPVIKFAYPIQRALKNKDGLLEMKEKEHLNTRSQDLESYFHDSGQFYWLKTDRFLDEKKIFTSKTGYIELKEYEAQDVDTMEDWAMLEIKYNYNKQ
ncbi:pseudaminic acid cytidylyltransferase [Maribacter sp.]|uniref:pseudaminic acid cytidylyltransferase n=1 Tax=Maribacter sp. TaxID=1897614 RepID=UPI0025C6D3FA|nr:pseudaminic acid cytidylyltransferase [Maribacter sp.]